MLFVLLYKTMYQSFSLKYLFILFIYESKYRYDYVYTLDLISLVIF